MYIIKKNNKRSSRKYFATYDEARNYVRKLIRKTDSFWGHINPPMNAYGYSVVRDNSCPF